MNILKAIGLLSLLSVSATILASVLVVVFGVPLLLLKAKVLLDLYTWFIVPLGAPGLVYTSAIGVTLFLNFIKTKVPTKATQEEGYGIFAQTLMGAVMYLLTWGVGAVFHFYIL